MAENEKADAMNAAQLEAKGEFDKIMSNPQATALELIAFHQKWYVPAGHKRLGQLYRDYKIE